MDQYLYRGVNAALYALNAGKLIPKEPRKRPERSGKWGYYERGGSGILWGDGVTWGAATLSNAANLHQRNSDHNPTAFVSTTPVLARARHYATHGGTLPRGYVYRIDVSLL